jgi:hypothetical protein
MHPSIHPSIRTRCIELMGDLSTIRQALKSHSSKSRRTNTKQTRADQSTDLFLDLDCLSAARRTIPPEWATIYNMKSHSSTSRYEPKDVEVRLKTPAGRLLRDPLVHRSLPKASTWVSLFDRWRDVGGHNTPHCLQVGGCRPAHAMPPCSSRNFARYV